MIITKAMQQKQSALAEELAEIVYLPGRYREKLYSKMPSKWVWYTGRAQYLSALAWLYDNGFSVADMGFYSETF